MKAAKQAAILILVAVISSLVAYSATSQLTPVQIQTITITKSVFVTESTPTVEDDYREAAEELLKSVMKWVEETRGLKFKENVSLKVLTREWVIEHWGKGFLNLTEVKIEETILKAFFLISPEFNLTKFKIGTSGYTVAASSGNTVYVVREYFDPYDEQRAGSILAHELTHILQGEYFDLPEPKTSDEENALLALVEGDANLVGYLYFESHGGGARVRIRENALDPMDALWYFPYMYGEAFVKYIYAKKGWSGVNELYNNPPTSTTEILHPEKYLEGWKPLKASFQEKIENGWILMLRDTLGEFFIRQMLRRHLSYQEANQSAEGWSGDVIELYEKNDTYLLRWKILWETEKDAEEFTTSFEKILQRVGAMRLAENEWKTGFETLMLSRSGTCITITITYTANPSETASQTIVTAVRF